MSTTELAARCIKCKVILVNNVSENTDAIPDYSHHLKRTQGVKWIELPAKDRMAWVSVSIIVLVNC